MKLFKKGGKLNIIDWILILALVAVVAFVFIAPKLSIDDGNDLGDAPPIEQTQQIEFMVACKDVDEILANSIIDSLSNGCALFESENVSMTRLYNNHKLVSGNVTAWEYSDGTLYLTINGNGLYANGAYAVGSQEVRLGNEYKVKTLGIEITGIIYTMECGK